MPKTKVNIKDVNAKQCKSCIFKENCTLISPERRGQIELYLLEGVNHICHVTDSICRGGRNYQLTIFHRMGVITEPTDEALYAASAKVLGS